MSEIVEIGPDLAKNALQVHGVDASGCGVLCRKSKRDQVLAVVGQGARLPRVKIRPCRNRFLGDD